MPSYTNEKATFNEKEVIQVDERSIRSTSTMNSLKGLLPKKKTAAKPKKTSLEKWAEQEAMRTERSIRQEATVCFLGYR